MLGVRDSVPDVSIADIAWIGAYLALGLGLLRLVRAHQRGRRDDVDGLIDLAAMFVVALLLAWIVVIAPTLADDTVPLSTRLVWSVYPALDAALLALLVRTVATRRHLGVLVLLVAGGVACWLAADIAYLATGLAAGYSIWLDAGWLLGGLLMAVATWQSFAGPDPDRSAPDDPGIGRVRIAVALVTLLVPPTVLLNEHLRGADPSVVPVGAVTVVLVALAYARALRLFHDATEARELVRSQGRFNATLAVNSSDAVVVLDADGRIIRSAPQLATLVGQARDAQTGRPLLYLVVPSDLAAAEAALRRALQMPGRVVDAELEVTIPGGDEFAVLIEDAQEPAAEAERVAGRILATVGERCAYISASLGLAVADHLATATSLLRDADIAMNEAKAAGRGRSVPFGPHMLQAAVARITIERELGAALERGQLHLDYQPVIALDTDRVVGFEARLRWTHPTLGDVPVETFLPVAERCGMLSDIGRFVLDEVWHRGCLAARSAERPTAGDRDRGLEHRGRRPRPARRDRRCARTHGYAGLLAHPRSDRGCPDP